MLFPSFLMRRKLPSVSSTICSSLGLFFSLLSLMKTMSPILKVCGVFAVWDLASNFRLLVEESNQYDCCFLTISLSATLIGVTFHRNSISLGDSPLYLILELTFLTTMARSDADIGPCEFVCRRISFSSS